jgi:uncharacterized Zn finger protein (UPF0148 family)
MLMCKACNTRFTQGTLLCPSCGRRASEHSTDAGSSGSAAIPLPVRSSPSPNEPEEIDLELDEDDVVARPSLETAAARDPRPQTGRTRRTPIDVEQVRAMIAEQPGLLEKGLGLHADDEGDPLGIDFPTPVGSIDVLGRDRKGGFVVVHVPAPDEVADSVSGMLRRMGWVRKHLSAAGDEVRGIVIVEQLPEDLAYAAAGAGGAIAFKGIQFALTFPDLEA